MRSLFLALFFALIAMSAAQLRVRDLAEIADMADPDETQFKPVVRARFLSSSTPKSSKKSKTGDSSSSSKSSKKSSSDSSPSSPTAPSVTTPSTVSSPSSPSTPTTSSSRRW